MDKLNQIIKLRTIPFTNPINHNHQCTSTVLSSLSTETELTMASVTHSAPSEISFRVADCVGKLPVQLHFLPLLTQMSLPHVTVTVARGQVLQIKVIINLKTKLCAHSSCPFDRKTLLYYPVVVVAAKGSVKSSSASLLLLLLCHDFCSPLDCFTSCM